MEKIKTRNPQEMYRRAKNPSFNNGKEIQFYQFWDWIQKDLTVSIYNINTGSKAPNGLTNTGLKGFGLNDMSIKSRTGLGGHGGLQKSMSFAS
jgi:hypothetical protein